MERSRPSAAARLAVVLAVARRGMPRDGAVVGGLGSLGPAEGVARQGDLRGVLGEREGEVFEEPGEAAEEALRRHAGGQLAEDRLEVALILVQGHAIAAADEDVDPFEPDLTEVDLGPPALQITPQFGLLALAHASHVQDPRHSTALSSLSH